MDCVERDEVLTSSGRDIGLSGVGSVRWSAEPEYRPLLESAG